jgi:mannose-6-phosphate isomerase-like protein (cupin superfamily)
MRILCPLLALIPAFAMAQTAPVLHPDNIAATTVSPGVVLKELTGRTSAPGARSTQASVAFFHLEPGRASAWSYNKLGEESFFVLKGHGTVWTGNRSQAVRPGSFILVPASTVRSIRASSTEALEFYAITTPAWSSDDDVHTGAPAGASK